MANPLEGIRITELSTMITGSLAGMLLADLGADVVKVEQRDGGDPFRQFNGSNYSGYFLSYNRNKRSLTLDLRAPEGRQIALDLIARSDVLIDNFRHGVLARLGLDPDTLAALNPTLVHASITGFGTTGPYVDRPAYDTVAQSLSGMLYQFIDADSPQPHGPTLSDNISGFYCAYGVLAALHERARTGLGQRVESNMLESTMAFAADGFVNFKRHGIAPDSLSRVRVSQSYAFKCADGLYLAIHLSSPAKFWTGLLAAIDSPEFARDSRFAERSQRVENYTSLAAELAPRFLSQPRAHWLERLTAQDVPNAPVLSIPDVFDDPQVRHMDSFYRIEHPVEGEVWGVKSPLRFNGQRLAQPSTPPALGEHSADVLAEIGVDAERYADLRQRKIV